MFGHELKYDLLVVLGTFSWIGLCIFHAIAYNIRKHDEQSPPDATATATNQGSGDLIPDWLCSALLGNIGIVLLCCYWRSQVIKWMADFHQLKDTFNEKIICLEKSRISLEADIAKISFENKVLFNVVQSNQCEFSRLSQILLTTLGVLCKGGSVVAMSGDDKDNTFNRSIRNMITTGKSNPKSIRSIRSEIILRRITRELLQPIRKQCNDIRHDIIKEHQVQRKSLAVQHQNLQRKCRSHGSIVMKKSRESAVARRKDRYTMIKKVEQQKLEMNKHLEEVPISPTV